MLYLFFTVQSLLFFSDSDLKDREWILCEIYDAQTNFELSTEPNHHATVRFSDSTYNGHTGCNSYYGKIEYSNEKIFYSAPEHKLKYAENTEKRLVEKYLLDCFYAGELSYFISNDTLTLKTNNSIILRFH